MTYRFSMRFFCSRLPQALGMIYLLSLTVSCGSKKIPSASAEPQAAIQVGSQKIQLADLQADLDDLAKRRNPLAADASTFLPLSVERLTALERAHQVGLHHDRELRRQWENLLIGRLQEQELHQKLSAIKVTDAEIEEFYQQQQSDYTRPAQLQLALLYFPVSRQTNDETRKAIRTRLEKARTLAQELSPDVKGFGAMAMEYSEEPTSRFKGGDVGWLQVGSPSRWPDEVLKAAFALDTVGGISDVIEASDGYYLLRKLDYREPAVQALDGRFRSSIANAIMAQKRETVTKELKKTWQDAHPAIINEKITQQLQYKKSLSPDPVFAEP